MLNDPGLQVLLLAIIVVVWGAEAHCHAVMLFFMMEFKFSFVVKVNHHFLHVTIVIVYSISRGFV